MLYLVALLIGLAVGRLRGGRLSLFAQLRLRWLWLVPIALVIQLLIFPWLSGRPLLPYATAPLHLVSYALLIVWMLRNLHAVPIRAFLLGAGCNLAAIAANGGFMPASVTALRGAGLEGVVRSLLDRGTVANVILMSDATRLNALGDWLYLPKWLPFSTAFSVGDVVIMIGLAWLAAWGMMAHD